jgi:hypothetical protein
MTTLLPATVITTAVASATGSTFQFQQQQGRSPSRLTIQVNFTWGSGGTTTDCYVQTSFDNGTTWVDIVNCHFTTSSLVQVANLSAGTSVTTLYTPTDAALASNTCKDGVLGNLLRAKFKSSGTYAGGTTLQVDVVTDRLVVK